MKQLVVGEQGRGSIGECRGCRERWARREEEEGCVRRLTEGLFGPKSDGISKLKIARCVVENVPW
jgi:hypothetical protein